MKEKVFNWIVIGSGPGGSTVASELSRVHGESVALLEAGPDPVELNAPAHSIKELRLMYKKAGLNFALTPFPLLIGEAQVLGGGSQINSGIYHRLPEERRERWEAENKIEGFKSRDLEPHHSWVENVLELQVPPPPQGFQRDLREVTQRFGFTWREPKVWWSQNTRTDLRQRLITPAEDCGLKVHSNCHVEKIEEKGTFWRITCSTPSGIISFRTNHLVLSAGAFGSQEILRSLALSPHSIFYHLQLRLLAKLSRPEVMDSTSAPPYQIEGDYGVHGFSVQKKNITAAFLADDPSKFSEYLKDPSSYVSLYTSPKIDCSMRNRRLGGTWASFTQEHKRRSILALEEIHRILKGCGIEGILTLGKDSQWNGQDHIFRKLKKSTVHLMGGVGMGEDQSSLCNSWGQVKGKNRLYVSDASLLNSSLNVNPQGTIMMIARRNVMEWLR